MQVLSFRSVIGIVWLGWCEGGRRVGGWGRVVIGGESRGVGFITLFNGMGRVEPTAVHTKVVSNKPWSTLYLQLLTNQ